MHIKTSFIQKIELYSLTIQNLIIDETEDIRLLNIKFLNITDQNSHDIDVIDEPISNLLDCMYNKKKCCSNYDNNGMSVDNDNVYCARYDINRLIFFLLEMHFFLLITFFLLIPFFLLKSFFLLKPFFFLLIHFFFHYNLE